MNNLKTLKHLLYECRIQKIPLDHDIPYKCASCDNVLYTHYNGNYKRCLECWGKINHVKNNIKDYFPDNDFNNKNIKETIKHEIHNEIDKILKTLLLNYKNYNKEPNKFV